jgi:hypothetical protein
MTTPGSKSQDIGPLDVLPGGTQPERCLVCRKLLLGGIGVLRVRTAGTTNGILPPTHGWVCAECAPGLGQP